LEAVSTAKMEMVDTRLMVDEGSEGGKGAEEVKKHVLTEGTHSDNNPDHG
jgi:hypothetical protein